jgi:sulfate adenylyltransferase subunit 1
MPVQYIIRPQRDEYHDFRGYAGRIAGGIFRPGDRVTVLPSMIESEIESVMLHERHLEEAKVGDSVTITLTDDIDISRGDMIVASDNIPSSSQELELLVCWFNERPLQVRGKYVVRHTTAETRCIIKSVDYKLDINRMEEDYEDKDVRMNDVARISVRTTSPLFFDSYMTNNTTGSLVLIEEGTNETVAAGMIS